jgi:hypothetical protein
MGHVKRFYGSRWNVYKSSSPIGSVKRSYGTQEQTLSGLR